MESNTSYIDLSRGLPDPRIVKSLEEIMKELKIETVMFEGIMKGFYDAVKYVINLRGIDFKPHFATSVMEVTRQTFDECRAVSAEEPTHDSVIREDKVVTYEGLVAEGKWEFKGDCFYFAPVNNPTGVVADSKISEEFLEDSIEKGVKIVEDDVYGYFSNSKALLDKNVVYTSSFTRILGPGLRVAFTNRKYYGKPSSISQYIISRLYEMGELQRIIKEEKEVYEKRLNEAKDFFSSSLYKVPQGGVSLLLTIPKEKFLVKVADGSRYFKRKEGRENLSRLTISRYSISEIRDKLFKY
ncbi:hypothetical protein [Acidianus ambivalens]|uniref:Aminotransferase class I/II-fold pyridoxal phosphate-dependent enzyme n=1 Tax=Acidianus ambivalens TaxID=2283 RepID=A0A650CTW7_ACIAM|nr:hypothetical protein [Acidianus ambivalens]MQL56301.1 hypothetical protein [Acidianus ambivalens]QGR21165.1 hypothetical protein D1866_03450 [Acidianus ambivalens]